MKNKNPDEQPAPGVDGAPFHHRADNLPEHTRHDEEVMSEARLRAYWRANVRLLAVLLLIWCVVSLGAGIVFADALNAFHIGGFPLGFWFAQQGSILVFVVLIFVYAWRMKTLERHFGVDDDRDGAGS